MCTHIDWHLVDMDTLLNAELGNEHVEGGIQHTDHLSWTNDRSVALREV